MVPSIATSAMPSATARMLYQLMRKSSDPEWELLRAGKSGDALREFETVLVKGPNRYRAFAGALPTARRSGRRVSPAAPASLSNERSRLSPGASLPAVQPMSARGGRAHRPRQRRLLAG